MPSTSGRAPTRYRARTATMRLTSSACPDRAQCVVSDQARELSALVVSPPFGRFVAPAAWVNRLITVGLLPDDLRASARIGVERATGAPAAVVLRRSSAPHGASRRTPWRCGQRHAGRADIIPCVKLHNKLAIALLLGIALGAALHPYADTPGTRRLQHARPPANRPDLPAHDLHDRGADGLLGAGDRRLSTRPRPGPVGRRWPHARLHRLLSARRSRSAWRSSTCFSPGAGVQLGAAGVPTLRACRRSRRMPPRPSR